MPKRTNEFQQLIAFIERELAEAGVKVTESAELEEYRCSPRREVDILVETEVNELPVKIAVECRDRRRPQDVEWIDGLIGKYQDLDVQCIVAVSKSGFTKGAREKAEKARIKTLTLREAQEADWPAEFIKPYVKFLALRDTTIHSVTLHYGHDTCPMVPAEQLGLLHIETGSGAVDGTVAGVAQRLFEQDAVRAFAELIDSCTTDQLNQIFRDCDEGTITRDIPYTTSDRFLVAPDGSRNAIARVVLSVTFRYRWLNADTQHFFYKSAQVTTGTLEQEIEPHKLMFTAVQMPKEPGRFKAAHFSTISSVSRSSKATGRAKSGEKEARNPVKR